MEHDRTPTTTAVTGGMRPRRLRSSIAAIAVAAVLPFAGAGTGP